ncbi:MAG: hypothetical protein JKX94_05150 [Sneathiella sp.]|nr:hypothetical protein [Sneathiella sp.]
MLISTSFVGQANGNDWKLDVAAYKIPNVLEPDGSGEYNKILKKITSKTGIVFHLDVLPIARARAGYKNGDYDCLIPLDPIFEQQHQDHLQSISFYEARLYAFTQREKAPITDIRGLDGLRVGGELGMPYTPELTRIIGNNKAKSLKSLVEMLALNRYEAILAYTPDILELLKLEGPDVLSYDLQFPLAIYKDSLTCRPTNRNSDLMIKINRVLTELGY